MDITGAADGVVVGDEVRGEGALEFGIVFCEENVEGPDWRAFKVHMRKSSKGEMMGKGQEEVFLKRETDG